MAYLNGVADAVKSAPNPASPALGNIPSQQLPPKPTGVGAMPTGSPTRTKTTVGGEAIAALRDLQGYTPELFNDINAFIGQIKNATKPKQGENPGPTLENRESPEQRNSTRARNGSGAGSDQPPARNYLRRLK